MTTPVTTISNPFTKDLLDRVVLIQQAVSGVRFAAPRFWEPIGNKPFPGFFNRAADVTFDVTRGQPIKRRVYNVEAAQQRLGYQGYTNPYDPTSPVIRLDALRYVESAFILPLAGGVQPFDYTEFNSGSPLFYLGIPYALQVTANFLVERKS
jgi:hypothetical protein